MHVRRGKERRTLVQNVHQSQQAPVARRLLALRLHDLGRSLVRSLVRHGGLFVQKLTVRVRVPLIEQLLAPDNERDRHGERRADDAGAAVEDETRRRRGRREQGSVGVEVAVVRGLVPRDRRAEVGDVVALVADIRKQLPRSRDFVCRDPGRHNFTVSGLVVDEDKAAESRRFPQDVGFQSARYHQC